jgi:glycosyltransferase involved in cell wall biosynthesis/GT2 family glycosyltransferase/predicted SAM-dependent methyltransferase
MTTPTRVSVVVSTYNRATGLRAVLEGLRHQTHDDFEVVVVNGPSTDDTARVLDEYADRIRIGDCPEQSLTVSRNVGIALASGDVVAFIDDDAIPEPAWLADLLAGYGDDVGGAGGIVWDHTGLRLQYRYSVCSRIGEPRWDVEPPLDAYLAPDSDPFLYLQGTNQSYLRRHLVEVGGFNEGLVHYFDDSEISMQLIDAGHRLRALPGAGVHHKYMASSVRNHHRVLVDPYRIIKDRFAFALLATATRPQAGVTDALLAWAETMRDGGRNQRDAGQLTDEQFEYYDRRVDEAVAASLDGARTPERPRRALPDANPDAFQRYPTLRTQGRRLTVCLLSKEYPPDDFGGVGRLAADFATEFAARGHEVHVVTETRDVARVDFEHGVWLHRLELGGPLVDDLADLPIGGNLALVRAMYGEVCRIHDRGPIDLVVGALWLAQGLICSLDPRFATVLLLESGTRTITDFHPSWEDSPQNRQLIALEGALFRHARHLHAISRDILRTVQAQYGRTDAPAFVLPLGRRDDHGAFRRARPADAPLRVLFVSRLERRKGVDVLLPVAARLVRRHPHVEVVLAGKDTEHTEIGETYTAAFRREHGGDREVTARVRFTGWLSEDELGQAYADADVFCLPARYESLGLVVIEAMAFGLPIVTSGVGGLVEIVEDGANGILVPVEDEAALEAALERLIADASLRRRFGERSRQLFEERFDLARTIPRTIEALEDVVASHAASAPTQALDRAEAHREVARRLPAIIADVTGLGPARAAAVTTALLDESWHARHVVQAIKKAWPLADDAFVRAVYPIILGRAADTAGVRHWTRLLGSGYPRLDVVEALATGEEATARKVDTSWLPVVRDALGASPAGGPTLPVRRASARTRAFATKLRSYVTSAAYLPTNVRELRAETSEVRGAEERLERALREHAARQVRLEEAHQRLEDAHERLEEAHAQTHAALTGQVLSRLDETLQHIAALVERTDGLARAQDERAGAARRDLDAYVERVDGGLRMLSDWVSLLQRKTEMLALDLREQVSVSRVTEELPVPQVADPERVRRMVAAAGGRLRLNLGCGERPAEGYVNVDFRAAPHVDVVADARRLPFDDGSVHEIASSHLIEHFRRHHFERVVLPYWRRLLATGGVLRTTCPNWAEMLRRLQAGEMSLDDFTLVTFGAQDYCGDDHFAMYTPATLRDLLARNGFEGIDIVAEARQNGLCPEMEIVARKAREEDS